MNIRTKLARERDKAAKPINLQMQTVILQQECFKALLRGTEKRRANLATKAA